MPSKTAPAAPPPEAADDAENEDEGSAAEGVEESRESGVCTAVERDHLE